ncbi:hypothetical protein SAMN02982922_0450 [Mesorhizobium australicum]|jgi:hypothetical protein|uniref:CobW/HypB/UreG nucleotide-binding domain-containing protein n=1 Tax=Mesorhizobium australicum TaxID=536018 RepID=A0A1X7MPP7_9HYPH|nr:hypothetical protein SAMN02982922_0450 [Mesorhizobium australicum]
MSAKAVRIGIGGPVGCRKTKLFERLLPLMHSAGLKLAAITNDLVTLEHAMRLNASGSRRDTGHPRRNGFARRCSASTVASSRYRFERRQNSKIAKLEETLRSRRVVNNAVRHLAAERSIRKSMRISASGAGLWRDARR